MIYDHNTELDPVVPERAIAFASKDDDRNVYATLPRIRVGHTRFASKSLFSMPIVSKITNE